MSVEMMDFPRTYAVRTLGCQMNEHDSERISGLLEKAGLVPVERARRRRASDRGGRYGRGRYRHQHVLRS